MKNEDDILNNIDIEQLRKLLKLLIKVVMEKQSLKNQLSLTSSALNSSDQRYLQKIIDLEKQLKQQEQNNLSLESQKKRIRNTIKCCKTS